MLTRRHLLCAGAGAIAGAPSVVAAVRHRRPLVAAERALDLAGGVDARRGDTVFLKVNTNSGDPYPYSTSPRLVGWLCARLRDQGARVVVGDRSFWGDRDTAGNLEQNGIAPAARRAGAVVTVLDDDVAWIELPPERVPSWRPPVRVPRLVVDADLVINLACMKTHFITGTTLALKCFLGLVHADDRSRPGNLRVHGEAIHRQIVELHGAVRAHMHVVDGHRALCAGGPTPSSGDDPLIRKTGVIVASSDPVAADVAAIALLQRYAAPYEAVHETAPWQSPTVAAARSVGLATRRLVLRQEGIDDPDRLARATAGAVA
jgi:uncharacterized protein (DUF362 family)